jgi:hypothetical protein
LIIEISPRSAYELDLEFLPDHRKAFSVDGFGVLSESGFEVGCSGAAGLRAPSPVCADDLVDNLFLTSASVATMAISAIPSARIIPP